MKKAFPISLDNELVEWILSKSGNERYRNRSHLVEVALRKFRDMKDEDDMDIKGVRKDG